MVIHWKCGCPMLKPISGQGLASSAGTQILHLQQSHLDWWSIFRCSENEVLDDCSMMFHPGSPHLLMICTERIHTHTRFTSIIGIMFRFLHTHDLLFISVSIYSYTLILHKYCIYVHRYVCRCKTYSSSRSRHANHCPTAHPWEVSLVDQARSLRPSAAERSCTTWRWENLGNPRQGGATLYEIAKLSKLVGEHNSNFTYGLWYNARL